MPDPKQETIDGLKLQVQEISMHREQLRHQVVALELRCERITNASITALTKMTEHLNETCVLWENDIYESTSMSKEAKERKYVEISKRRATIINKDAVIK